jgi:hypothetical protein
VIHRNVYRSLVAKDDGSGRIITRVTRTAHETIRTTKRQAKRFKRRAWRWLVLWGMLNLRSHSDYSVIAILVQMTHVVAGRSSYIVIIGSDIGTCIADDLNAIFCDRTRKILEHFAHNST